MTLDDVVTMLLAEAILGAHMRGLSVPRRLVWRAVYVRAHLAERAMRAGWVYR